MVDTVATEIGKNLEKHSNACDKSCGMRTRNEHDTSLGLRLHEAPSLFSPGLLYAIGGFDGVSPLRSGEQFDIGTNKWTPIPDMNTKRFGLGACACEGEEAKLPAVYNFNLSLSLFSFHFPPVPSLSLSSPWLTS